MRISDWRSDVCSSDLGGLRADHVASLRQIAYGGSAITGALLDRARATLGCDFAQLYGMTETTGAGTVLSPEEHDRSGKAGSCGRAWPGLKIVRSEEHTSELQSLMRISYAVFCLKKKKKKTRIIL